jgi:hypothetical protein
MRKFLVVALVVGMIVVAAPAMAGAPTFPDFTPMDAGPERVAVDNFGSVFMSVGIPGDPPRTEIWKFDPSGDRDRERGGGDDPAPVAGRVFPQATKGVVGVRHVAVERSPRFGAGTFGTERAS